MRRRGLRIATETRPAHSLQQKLAVCSILSHKLKVSGFHVHQAKLRRIVGDVNNLWDAIRSPI